MQGSSLFSTVAKLATVAALCVPFVAQADKSSSSASSALTGQRSSLVTFSPGASTDFVFDVTGIGSWDSQGSATNETVWNRPPERAERLVADLGTGYVGPGGRPWPRRQAGCRSWWSASVPPAAASST